ncbi:carbonic anhydrase-related protein 10-like [Penaeus japonicus]|uniref:carbonic anhydrase-related protein 10-like n=1 Tax=Penaeus japonicus TaxID=27405 RepID=UPI001C7141B8|nr:carbonic anhydrase-related protein 10-like [Penaeus japonicus]
MIEIEWKGQVGECHSCCLLASWDEWWTYDGISGPEFWGLINPNWNMCERGRRQSPVNIEPSKLVYDPHLRHVHVDKQRVSFECRAALPISLRVRVALSPYLHVNTLSNIEPLYLTLTAEHIRNVGGTPQGIQLYGFNADLYRNMTEARMGSNGIVGLSIMVQVGEEGNEELRILSSGFNKVVYRGMKWPVKHLSLAGLLPDTHHYMTYDGSTTHPGCWETSTWLVMNKPIYITKQELYALRQLMQGDQALPKARMANNFRPVKALHHRTVRTNIDFTNAHRAKACPSMHREMYYAAQEWPTL